MEITPAPAFEPAPERLYPRPEDVQAREGRKSRGRRTAGGAVALLVAAGAKLKALLLVLPKLKLLTSSATALVSVAAYSLLWGWTFAVGFVALLFVHEMGHVLQLRREGVRASAPMFIPFLGAVISAKSLGKDALAEARVGLAGPILGTLGAAAVAVYAALSGSQLAQALAYVGFLLNLFNLIPVLPLDGGRAMAAMAPWMWFAGFALIVAAVIFFPSPILLLVALFGGMETWRRWKARRSRSLESAAYYRVPTRARYAVAAVYVGLIAVLVAGMDLTYLHATISGGQAAVGR